MTPEGAHSAQTSLQLAIDHSLSFSLQRFWEQEDSLTPLIPLTSEELECEEHFVKTHSRDFTGRYIVRLPIKKSLHTFGDSYNAAFRMLERMENRFVREPQFGTAYSDFITEYEALTHMEMVPRSMKDSPLVYYLPHHGVIRESSETTKLRVVFKGLHGF